jgi:hypothetical protein
MGASEDETKVLKRNTISPRQDFVVLTLGASTREQILKALGGTFPGKRILHIQIEKAGTLQFGAYDRFACVFFGPGVASWVIDSLVAKHLLRPVEE